MVSPPLEPTLPNLPGAGGVSALTTFSPVVDLPALRRRLALVANWPGIGRPLLELAFVHYARWTVIGQLPAPGGGQRPYELNWPYLLFQSSFDGTLDEYLDAFADVLPWRLIRIFGTCFGFEQRVVQAPGADGRAMAPWAFRRFVKENTLQQLDFRPAPTAPVSVVRQALLVERLERRASRLDGDDLAEAQRDLELLASGPAPARVGFREGIAEPLLRRALPGRNVTALTIVAPLNALADLPPLWAGGARPLRGLPEAHFTRVVLIPERLTYFGQPYPDVLPTPYLLFSCDYRGTLEDYVEAVRSRRASREALDNLFGACVDYPGTRIPWALRTWLDRHRIRPSYALGGYAPRSLDELRGLVAARTRIARRVERGL